MAAFSIKNLSFIQRICPNSSAFARYYASEAKRTALYQYHVQAGAKIVQFAGFSMPVQYKESIKDSHLYTRSHASLFDVSHMLQTKIHGKDRIKFIESLTVADVKSMSDDQSTLSLFTNAAGGIEDDLIITRSPDFLFLVTNAGRIPEDKELLEEAVKRFKSSQKDVCLEYLDNDYSLMALQGPLSQSVLQKAVKYDLSKHKFMYSRTTDVLGFGNCRVTRCGYTGEDGFEISIPNIHVEKFVDFVTDSNVKLAGLGARDSLRLEAGLCLYGNDIDATTTPVEAGLVWTIGKSRRSDADFPGAAVILQQIKEKPKRKRVGLVAIEAGPAARHGSSIEWNGTTVGIVTSGCPSPSLSRNIAMAYMETTAAKIGTQVNCVLRGKRIPHKVCKMPFVPSKYYV